MDARADLKFKDQRHGRAAGDLQGEKRMVVEERNGGSRSCRHGLYEVECMDFHTLSRLNSTDGLIKPTSTSYRHMFHQAQRHEPLHTASSNSE